MTTKREQATLDDQTEQQNMIVDQREANARMVSATIRAQELTELAEAAQARAEATTNELRESEERYRTLFDLAPAAVYSCDASGVIQKFNRHAVALWGREPAAEDPDERFCGSFKMFRPDGSFMPHDQCPMADVLSGRLSEARDAEVVIERPDGTRVTAVVNIRPLKNQRGEVTGAINCAYDITARKRAEKEVADSLNSERAVAEFREMFIGIVGHDLRNPLGSILMSAGRLLQRGHLDDQDAETTARIIRGSQRITRMITQLLDLTRARLGGGLSIEPKPIDLREVCQSVVEEFEATIQLEMEGDLTGTWDRDRLAQVLSNLAGNAIAYAAPGTMVTVKARANGAAVVVEVSNQGDPIPVDVLPFIFEPFRRAQLRKASAAGNLGLGLYIAHQIVLSHGGTLEAHSADGTTTFAMHLPRHAT
jgi:PAS domain S-box-containing protein